MLKNILKYIFFIMLTILFSFASLYSAKGELDNILLEMELSEQEVSQIIEDIEYYKSNKINLYKVSSYKLSKLPYFSQKDAQVVIDHITKAGNIDNIEEEIELSTLQLYILQQCTYYEEEAPSKKTKNTYYFRNLSDFPLQRNHGIKSGKYLGSNFATANKAIASISGYKVGFNLDKDLGEREVYDFHSFYVEKEFGQHNLIVGNFKQVNSLGLLYGANMSRPKFITISSIDEEIESTIRADLSNYNSRTFRGLAYHSKYKLSDNNSITSAFLYSYQNRDATVNDTGAFSNIYGSNLFRTENELSKRDAIVEHLFGATSAFQSEAFKLQYSALVMNYNRHFTKENWDIPANKWTYIHSLSLQFNLSNLESVNEFALYKLYPAVQSNWIYTIDKHKLKLSLRYYSPDYFSPFAANNYQSTTVNNEWGVSLAYISDKRERYHYSLAMDYFARDKRVRITNSINSGLGVEFRNTLKVNDANSLFLGIQYLNNMVLKSEAKEKVLRNLQRAKARGYYKYQISNSLNCLLRTEVNNVFSSGYDANRLGYMLAGEAEYNQKAVANLSLALAYYETYDFASAVYFYNSFYNYSSNIKALYNNGIFAKVEMQYTIFQYFKASLQYWINHKFNVSELSSGNGKINANYEHYLRFALEFKM